MELECLLAVLEPTETLAVALMLFAGLRWGEIERLVWEDLDWQNDSMFVRGQIAATSTDRTIKLHRTLALFLLRAKPATGPVCNFPIGSVRGSIKRKLRCLGIRHISNGFRHCYWMFRLAEAQGDTRQVSEEMGNAVTILETFYDGSRINEQDVARYWILKLRHLQ